MKRALLCFVIILFCLQSFSQLLSWPSDFLLENTNSLVITADASIGNQALLNYTPTTDVYVHTGVITNLSTNSTNWKYVKFSQDF